MARPRTPSLVVIAYDATKDRGLHELSLTVNGVRKWGDILSRGDTIVFLGVLGKVLHPCKYLDCAFWFVLFCFLLSEVFIGFGKVFCYLMYEGLD